MENKSLQLNYSMPMGSWLSEVSEYHKSKINEITDFAARLQYFNDNINSLANVSSAGEIILAPTHKAKIEDIIYLGEYMFEGYKGLFTVNPFIDKEDIFLEVRQKEIDRIVAGVDNCNGDYKKELDFFFTKRVGEIKLDRFTIDANLRSSNLTIDWSKPNKFRIIRNHQNIKPKVGYGNWYNIPFVSNRVKRTAKRKSLNKLQIVNIKYKYCPENNWYKKNGLYIVQTISRIICANVFNWRYSYAYVERVIDLEPKTSEQFGIYNKLVNGYLEMSINGNSSNHIHYDSFLFGAAKVDFMNRVGRAKKTLKINDLANLEIERINKTFGIVGEFNQEDLWFEPENPNLKYLYYPNRFDNCHLDAKKVFYFISNGKVFDFTKNRFKVSDIELILHVQEIIKYECWLNDLQNQTDLQITGASVKTKILKHFNHLVLITESETVTGIYSIDLENNWSAFNVELINLKPELPTTYDVECYLTMVEKYYQLQQRFFKACIEYQNLFNKDEDKFEAGNEFMRFIISYSFTIDTGIDFPLKIANDIALQNYTCTFEFIQQFTSLMGGKVTYLNHVIRTLESFLPKTATKVNKIDLPAITPESIDIDPITVKQYAMFHYYLVEGGYESSLELGSKKQNLIETVKKYGKGTEKSFQIAYNKYKKSKQNRQVGTAQNIDDIEIVLSMLAGYEKSISKAQSDYNEAKNNGKKRGNPLLKSI